MNAFDKVIAALTTKVACAERNLREQEEHGDMVSAASARGTYCALREARDLVVRTKLADAMPAATPR